MARTFIGTASAPLPFSALVKSAFVPSSEGVRAALTGLARTTFGRLTEEEREELSAKFLACCMLVVGHTQRRPQERMAKVGGRKHASRAGFRSTIQWARTSVEDSKAQCTKMVCATKEMACYCWDVIYAELRGATPAVPINLPSSQK
jgi:hypothetical protein